MKLMQMEREVSKYFVIWQHQVEDELYFKVVLMEAFTSSEDGKITNKVLVT